MTKMVWSVLPEEEKNRKISTMDRYVAGGWFDICRPDTDHKYRRYKHNVPHCDSDYGSDASDRSVDLNMIDNLSSSLYDEEEDNNHS